MTRLSARLLFTQRGKRLKRVIKDDVAQRSGMSGMFYTLFDRADE